MERVQLSPSLLGGIPAKAGIPLFSFTATGPSWTPAFAGVTPETGKEP